MHGIESICIGIVSEENYEKSLRKNKLCNFHFLAMELVSRRSILEKSLCVLLLLLSTYPSCV